MLAARQAAPSAEVRWLRFTVRKPREGERRYLGGCFYVHTDGDWRREAKRRELAPDVMRDAICVGSAAQKKFEAAPEWADLIARFGEQGAVRNAKGQVTGYRYPQSTDEAEQRKINESVVELWAPHMRVGTEIGAEASAKVEHVTLKDKRTGQTFTAHPSVAEKKAKKRGLVEVRRTRVKSVLNPRKAG